MGTGQGQRLEQGEQLLCHRACPVARGLLDGWRILLSKAQLKCLPKQRQGHAQQWLCRLSAAGLLAGCSSCITARTNTPCTASTWEELWHLQQCRQLFLRPLPKAQQQLAAVQHPASPLSPRFPQLRGAVISSSGLCPSPPASHPGTVQQGTGQETKPGGRGKREVLHDPSSCAPKALGCRRVCTSGQEQSRLRSLQQSHLFRFPAPTDLQVETHMSTPPRPRGNSRCVPPCRTSTLSGSLAAPPPAEGSHSTNTGRGA